MVSVYDFLTLSTVFLNGVCVRFSDVGVLQNASLQDDDGTTFI